MVEVLARVDRFDYVHDTDPAGSRHHIIARSKTSSWSRHRFPMNSEMWIALDGGTTNTRASVVENGKITDTVKFDVGVRDTRGDGDNAVKAAVRACLDTLFARIGLDPASVNCVASGMLGSEAGLVNLPHVLAPAGAEELAKGSVIWRDPLNPGVAIRILPGIRTGPDLANPDKFAGSLVQDIMRGEETQVWGVRETLSATDPEALNSPWLLVWPGSHTKLIAVEADGTITGSFTTLAGETYSALKSATLLKRSVPEEPARQIEEPILDKAARAVESTGLMRAAFWTRVADISGGLNAQERGQWLSAIVTAEDAWCLTSHPWTRNRRFASILVGGEPTRQSAYYYLLEKNLGNRVRKLDAEVIQSAAAVGAVRLGQWSKS